MEKKIDRIKLIFLLENCPFLRNNPEECPLFLKRKESILKKKKWIDKLSDEEISEILIEHNSCHNNLSDPKP